MDEYGLTQTYYNENALQHAEEQRMQDWKPYLEEFVYRIPGPRVLDVGCSNGRWTRMLANRGCRVTGIDFSKQMVRYCNIRMPDIEIVEQDMRTLEIGEKFDGIWICSSLMHIKKNDALSVVRRFYKMLQNSGVMFVSVLEGNGERLESDEHGERLMCRYTREELESLVKEAGFTKIESDIYSQNGSDWLVMIARR